MTEPTPTLTELNRAISDASREYINVVRTYPRDTAKIAAAKAAVTDLVALRDELYPPA